MPEKFKLGNPTPGQPNDCSGPHFVLNDHISNSIITAYNDDYDDLGDASCSVECTTSTCTADQSINFVDNNLVEQEFRLAIESSTKDTCTSLMLYPDGSNIAINVEQENSRKRHISVEKDYFEEPEWQTTKFFR